MSDGHPVETDPTTVSRRGFLKATGAGVAGGTLAAMLDARQAPAQIRGTTLRILQWSHFIPAYDNWFDTVFVKEWGDKNGVKVRVDHIPHLELPARMAAEFAAGAGHDIIHNGSSILTRLYYKSLADISDIYDAAGKKHGGGSRPPAHWCRWKVAPTACRCSTSCCRCSGGRISSRPTTSRLPTPGSWRAWPPARSSPRATRRASSSRSAPTPT